MVNKRQYEVKVQTGAWDFSIKIGTIFCFLSFSVISAALEPLGQREMRWQPGSSWCGDETFAAVTAPPSGVPVRSPSPASRAE